MMRRSLIPLLSLAAFLFLNAVCSTPVRAQSGDEADRSGNPVEVAQDSQPADAPLTPGTLTDALSCRSRDAHMSFATALFLDEKQLGWMRKYEGREAEGMIGVYGYKLRTPITFFGFQVDKIFFMKDWIVTALSRQEAQALISDQHLERAPVRMAEQYFRFIDPEGGPMLGAFAPTGNLLANSLAAAFGAEPPPSLPAETLFVGCNYTPVSRGEFLEMAGRADGLIAKANRDIDEMVSEPETEQAPDKQD